MHEGGVKRQALPREFRLFCFPFSSRPTDAHESLGESLIPSAAPPSIESFPLNGAAPRPACGRSGLPLAGLPRERVAPRRPCCFLGARGNSRRHNTIRNHFRISPPCYFTNMFADFHFARSCLFTSLPLTVSLALVFFIPPPRSHLRRSLASLLNLSLECLPLQTFLSVPFLFSYRSISMTLTKMRRDMG